MIPIGNCRISEEEKNSSFKKNESAGNAHKESKTNLNTLENNNNNNNKICNQIFTFHF